MNAPDPLDAAAIRICGDQLARSAGIDACVVPLSVAKTIRDQAVEQAQAEATEIFAHISGALDGVDDAAVNDMMTGQYVALDPVEHIGPCEETTS